MILLAVAISIVIGVPLGLVSGYLGGWLDRVLVLVTDALFAFPSLLLAIIVNIAVAGGTSSKLGGILAAAISITVVYVPQYFRVVRNATVAAREEPYVEAARALGASPRVIMTRYIFGNVVQTVPVIATLNAGDAILTLAGLGFLGYGIEPSAGAEWGHDLSRAVSDTAAGIWWTGLYPGLAIVLIVVGVTLVGESLNDVLNPLLRTFKVSAGRPAGADRDADEQRSRRIDRTGPVRRGHARLVRRPGRAGPRGRRRLVRAAAGRGARPGRRIGLRQVDARPRPDGAHPARAAVDGRGPLRRPGPARPAAQAARTAARRRHGDDLPGADDPARPA